MTQNITNKETFITSPQLRNVEKEIIEIINENQLTHDDLCKLISDLKFMNNSAFIKLNATSSFDDYNTKVEEQTTSISSLQTIPNGFKTQVSEPYLTIPKI